MATILGPYEFVVGSDRRDLIISYEDENGNPIDITDAQAVEVEGESPDLPAVDLDKSGTVLDGPSGKARFAGFGNAVTVAQLGALASATYTCRARLRDAAGKTTFTPLFIIKFLHQPLT